MTEQPKTLDTALSQFKNIMQKSPVDVVLKLLESPSLYHTEIINVPVMNAIKMQINLCETKDYPKTKKFWEDFYQSILDHMVSHKRKRAGEIEKIMSNMLALLGIESKEKKGLFNR